MILNIFDVSKRHKKVCYWSGDFNIDCFKADKHRPTADFLEIMYSHSFIPLITRPTRITSSSATLIDNIFTNDLQKIQNSFSGLLTTDISDHFPVFHIISDKKEKDTEVYFWKRIMTSANKNKFKELLSSEDWSYILDDNNAATAFSSFHSRLVYFYDQTFPMTYVKYRYNNRNHGCLIN